MQALRLCTGRTAHRGSKGIARLFIDHGTRRGWGVSVTPRPLFTPGKDPVLIVQEAGWAPGPVWTAVENLAPTGILSPDRPARSQSLFRLHYPAYGAEGGSRDNDYGTMVEWYRHGKIEAFGELCVASVTFSTTILSTGLRSTLGLRDEMPPEPISLHGMQILLKINFINNKAIQQVYNFKYLGYTNILMTTLGNTNKHIGINHFKLITW